MISISVLCLPFLWHVASCFTTTATSQQESAAYSHSSLSLQLSSLNVPFASLEESVESDIDFRLRHDYNASSRTEHQEEPACDRDVLSHVGRFVYSRLSNGHYASQGILWSLTSGAVVERFHISPDTSFDPSLSMQNCNQNRDDWFAAKLGAILSRCEAYADVVSLQPPDGKFLQEFRKAIYAIATAKRQSQQEQPTVVIRMMFGHMLGCKPVDCRALVQDLSRELVDPSTVMTTNVCLWVAAWRQEWCSWNHAKLVAVDGKWIHTGGHNLWSQHYLNRHPLHDVSVELVGTVAQEGHTFANQQWAYVKNHLQRQGVDSVPWPWARPTHVSMHSFSPNDNHAIFPPPHRKRYSPLTNGGTSLQDTVLQSVPMLTVGKFRAWNPQIPFLARPSNDAILALLQSARSSIRLAIQDLGPRCWPYTQVSFPGHPWPSEVLSVLARAIWIDRVTVEIVLSNRDAVCGGLPATNTLARPNGWSVQQVWRKIVQTIQSEFPSSRMAHGQQVIQDGLRVCGFRQHQGDTFRDGTKMGLHSKCFIVDDIAFYMGSQNLYSCDLAEWGVVIDDAATTKKLIQEYWAPLWRCSYGP
jgi:phosphatidylserine/phosphatidylglycerophosphate/cardiolipin synthase-like enzyme